MSRIGRVRLAILAGLVCIAGALLWWGATNSSPTLASRVKSTELQLRCPVCQGESVYESPSGLAAAMRSIVHRMLEKGATSQQVINYFVARYGDWILLAPPDRGIGLVAWIGPPLLALLGFVTLAPAAFSWRRQVGLQRETIAAMSAEDQDFALRRVDEIAEQGDFTPSGAERRRHAIVSASLVEEPHRWALGPSGSVFASALLAFAVLTATLISLATLTSGSSAPSSPQVPVDLQRMLAIVKHHPRSSSDWTDLASILLAHGQTPAAISAFNRAIGLDHSNSTARYNLATVYIGEQKARRSFAVLRPLVRSQRGSARFWLLEGLAHGQLRQKSAAIRDLSRAIAIAPSNSLSASERAWIAQLRKGERIP